MVPMGSPSGLSAGVIGSGGGGGGPGRGPGEWRGGLRPGTGQGGLLAAGLRILRQRIRGQRFGTQAELHGLLHGHHADRAPSLEKSGESHLRGENGGQRHQYERDDQRHAALPTAVRPAMVRTPPHPATSTSRRILPQSFNSMISSPATGRIERLSEMLSD